MKAETRRLIEEARRNGRLSSSGAIGAFLSEHKEAGKDDVLLVMAGETYAECRGCAHLRKRTGEISKGCPCFDCSRRVKTTDRFEPEEDDEEEDDGANLCVYSEDGKCLNPSVCGGGCSGTKRETEKCLPFLMAEAWMGESWKRKE